MGGFLLVVMDANIAPASSTINLVGFPSGVLTRRQYCGYTLVSKKLCAWVKRLLYSILFLIFLAAGILHIWQVLPWRGQTDGLIVECRQTKIPDLTGSTPIERSARICFPVTYLS